VGGCWKFEEELMKHSRAHFSSIWPGIRVTAKLSAKPSRLFHRRHWQPFLTGVLVLALVIATPVAGRNSIATPKSNEVSAPSCTSTEPIIGLPNLDFVKKKLIAYHDCDGSAGCYEHDLEAVGSRALDFLKQYRSAHSQDKNLAVVMDIDETALTNWGNMKRMDFAYDHDETLLWESQAKAPAVKPVLGLFDYARDHHIATVFLTGRGHAERDVTVKDLTAAGYKDWTKLIVRNQFSPPLADDYKAAERKMLEQDGYTIVVNIGDQCSDLAGGHALKTFKLPNPFYYIP
jgi:HAD superfamily, subfamily IIIB (Acid phosphatase)